MKKLFTLAAAVLASFSLLAVDPSYQSSEWAKQADAEAALGKHGNVTLAQSGLSYGNLGSNGAFYYVAVGQNLKSSDSDWKYFSIVADENYFIDSVSVWYCENGSNETNVAWIGWGEGVTPEKKSLAHGETAGTKGSKKLADAKWVTIDAHTYDIQTMYLSRSIREFQDAEEKNISNFGKGQSFNILGFKIWLRKGCSDPESTIKADTTLYIGDSYNIGFNSINTNGCTVDVKKNGAAAADDVDYTKTNINNYTFLKAGEYVITISQAADGTHCAVEESVTVTVNEATPVESVTIADAAHSARIGGSVELSATAANASEYQWFLNDEAIEGAESASYTFNATAAGTYSFVCKARNDFNSGTWVASAAHVITVAVGTDAKLSALSVAGKTLTPAFDAATLEYTIGEIGVYETPNATATAADAPYATVGIVDDKAGTITITVTAEDKTTKQDYVLTYTRATATELVAISESVTWDFTKTGSSSIQFTDETLVKKGVTEFNFADVLTNPDASFKATSLNGIGEFAVRESKYFQGGTLKFTTTVPGKLEVVYSNTGNRDADKGLERILTVNGTKIGDGALRSDKDVTESNIAIAVGEVVIKSVLKADDSEQYIRVKKVAFTKSETTAISNSSDAAKAQKRIENGQLVIEKNGQVFNAMGQAIR